MDTIFSNEHYKKCIRLSKKIKPTLLQINVTANWGSTGKIAEQIGLSAMSCGWHSYIAYGRMMNPSKNNLIKIGSRFDVYEHYCENRLFDNEGLASRQATIDFLKKVDVIKPDIVHLHNIHDHYINYHLLFIYLKEKKIPVVWTQHDCWAFTGGCFYYSMSECDKWQIECDKCPFPRGIFYDRTNYQYNLRKRLFSSLDNITFVPVSEWLEGEIRKSILKNKKIYTIFNGVDLQIFKPSPSSYIREKYHIGNTRFILAVATIWSSRKGLNDYIKLASILSKDLKLVLVGLSDKQTKGLPSNIIVVPRTQNAIELSQLYTEASIVLNLSYEETFGLTTVEGYACGTPGIVYNCTASPELVSPETGCVVRAGDINGVNIAIKDLLNRDQIKLKKDCRQKALEKYNKDICFNKYVDLYNSLL